MSRKVVFRPEAEQDLVALYDYIADRSGHRRAAGYVARIEAACLSLATFPERGTPRDDLAPGIRIVGFERRVTIAFCISDDAVRIVRLFYACGDIEAGFEDPDDD